MTEPKKKPAAPQKTASAVVKNVVSKTGNEIRGIVRIAGKDMKGEVELDRALGMVKGVGERLGLVMNEAVLRELKLPEGVYVGELSEEQIDKIEHMLSNPVKFGVPLWMINRRRDVETGEDKHLIGTDLTFAVRQDIDREKNMNSWIGYRHNYGQKVRGQHTRTTGRKGMSVGVLRSAILAAKKGAAAGAAGAPAAAEKKAEKK